MSIIEANYGENRKQQYLLRPGTSKPAKTQKNKNYKYKIDQTVCLSHVRSVFDRGYLQKWTGELFKIDSRFRREGVPVNTILDWDGERVNGTFYEPELQPVTINPTTEHRMEKILKRRVRNERKEVLLRWLHWPKKCDSWIPEEDVKTIISHVNRTLINTLTIPIATHSTMKITNVVCSAHLNCTLDLIWLCQHLRNCRYEPRSFPGLIGQHRNIGSNCFVFANGVINSNGKESSFHERRQRLRRYARLLQKYGCPVYLTDAKIIRASASHTLSGVLDLYRLAGDRSLLYKQ